MQHAFCNMHVLKGSIPPEMFFSLRKCMFFECNLVSMSAVQKFGFPNIIASYNIIQVCSRSCGSTISLCSHKTPLSIQPKIKKKTQTSSKFTRRPRQSRKNYPQKISPDSKKNDSNYPNSKKSMKSPWFFPIGFSPWLFPMAFPHGFPHHLCAEPLQPGPEGRLRVAHAAGSGDRQLQLLP